MKSASETLGLNSNTVTNYSFTRRYGHKYERIEGGGEEMRGRINDEEGGGLFASRRVLSAVLVFIVIVVAISIAKSKVATGDLKNWPSSSGHRLGNTPYHDGIFKVC